MSVAAYKRIIEETETPRQIERRLLARLSGQLEEHQIYFDAAAPADRLALLAGELSDALWQNERLWQSLMVDVAQPENALPAAIKAGILSIGNWVERHTQQVMRGNANLAALIVVNRSIERGLAGDARPVAGAGPAPAEPQVAPAGPLPAEPQVA